MKERHKSKQPDSFNEQDFKIGRAQDSFEDAFNFVFRMLSQEQKENFIRYWKAEFSREGVEE